MMHYLVADAASGRGGRLGLLAAGQQPTAGGADRLSWTVVHRLLRGRLFERTIGRLDVQADGGGPAGLVWIQTLPFLCVRLQNAC